jgi:glycosyltransferase involved in cell wall biosynthesis
MPVDVLIVALSSTAGLRAAEDELAGSLRRAGASVEVVMAAPQSDVRTLMLTDLRWARAARRAAKAGIAEHSPRAIVYSTTTAAMFWPARGAIRFDATAAENRPGRHGLWQRPLERRRLREATLLIPQAGGTIAVPIPVEPSGPPGTRDIAAITYGTNPHKKGLDRVLAAWAIAREPGEELVVAGIDGPHADGVRHTGMLPPADYRALLRRSRVYVTAPRREDYGLAQLEALADGCALVTNAAPGPYAALPLARALDPRWIVSEDPSPTELAAAIRAALDDPPADLTAHALDAIAPYRRAAVDAIVATELLPRLLARPRE